MNRKLTIGSIMAFALAMGMPMDITASVGASGRQQTGTKQRVKATGNPVLPGFHADPEILYSDKTKKYYIYSTTDGVPGWGGWQYYCYSSKNLRKWKNEGVVLDAKSSQVAWANGNLWAPAAVEVRTAAISTSSITAPTLMRMTARR